MSKTTRNTALHYGVKPTQELYDDLGRIISHLNYRLFNDELPECLLSLRSGLRYPVCLSYQHLKQRNVHSSPTILFDPKHFTRKPSIEWVASLTKALTDLWQYYFGAPSRRGYHNREWANKMKAIGLRPSSTGEAGGKETGDKITYFIIADGLFECTTKEIQSDGLLLRWQAQDVKATSAKSGKRVKYQCPLCMINAWAKEDTSLICGKHHETMLPKN